jgi:4-hydroxybenzoate polyprenyltransferase
MAFIDLKRIDSERLRGHLQLSRLSNGPTVVTNVLAGAALAGQTIFDPRVAALTAAMLLFYAGGMYLNDVCDFDFDRRHRPDRPLATGAVSRREAAVYVGIFFGMAALLLSLFAPASLPAAIVLGLLIVVYDVRHKQNPAAPIIMGLIRGMVYITAFSAFAAPISAILWIWAGLLCLYIVRLTALARAEKAPRKTHLRLAGICLLDGLVLLTCGHIGSAVIALGGFGLTLFLHRYIKGT